MFIRTVYLLLMLFFIINPLQSEPDTVDTVTTSAPPSYYQKLKYEASLTYTKYGTKGNWWDKIEPFKIYLGALPLKNAGHLDAIINLGIRHILSMVEDFEMEDGWFNTPVKLKDWNESGIEMKHIQAVDFLPLKRSEIDEGVEYLNNVLKEGHSIYVHCKAGRGRSATIVIVYLMKYHQLSFEEAFSFVKKQRPQINLNTQQRQAILDYFSEEPNQQQSNEKNLNTQISEKSYSLFQNMNEMSSGMFAKFLNDMLYYVIHGANSTQIVPLSLSTWIPSIEIQSTIQRRDRYLREYQGDQVAATEAAIKRNHNLIRRFKLLAANAIPFIGTPTKYSISLWHQLREIALIAAIHGHDIQDKEIQIKILSCLVGGDLLKIPAQGVDFVAREILKKMAASAGIDMIGVIKIPTHLIFNFFTENSAHVATYAKEMFATKG